MEKGNKVLIKDTDTIWDGKHGTVIAEEDGQVEVRINFETEDGTKQVIEIFNEENLEMEREDESLNENKDLDFEDENDDDEIDYSEVYEEIKNTETFNEMTITSKTPEGEEFQVNVLYHDSPKEIREWIEEMLEQYPYYFDNNEIIADPWNDNANGYFFIDGQRASYIYGELVVDGEPIRESLNEDINSNEKWFVSWNSREDWPFGVKGNPERIKKELENAVEVTPIENGKESLIWIDFKHHLAGERKVNVPADIRHKDNLEDHDKKYYWFSPDSFYTEKELFDESLNEDLEIKPTKKKDIIHRYVHLEDLDGKEVPNWNFASRIATAEDIEEGCVCELAHDLGYKVFAIEAPGFFRTVIAAKGIKAEDIEEEYADFLQGRACIRELEWK